MFNITNIPEVNKKLAEIQDNSRELNKRFIPTPELMSHRFDIK